MNVNAIINSKGSDVYTISQTSTLGDAVRLLAERNIGALVVTDEKGACSGILSERDIVRQLSATAGGADHLRNRIESCMTKNVHTCPLSADLEEVLAMMTQKRIRHLPVVENDALVGIISIGDVVKLKIDMAEREAEDLRSYIAAG